MPAEDLCNRLLGPVSPASRVALSVLDKVDMTDCSVTDIAAAIFRALDEIKARCPAAEDREIGRATVAGWVSFALRHIEQGDVRGAM